jgi:hypothetical protein
MWDYAFATNGLGRTSVSEQARKMDLGLGEYLRQFDEHFGKKATRLLLALVAIAVVGECCHVIYESIVKPCYRCVQWLSTGNRLSQISAAQLISTVATAVIFAGVYYALVRVAIFFLDKKMTKAMGKLVEFANAVEKQQTLVEESRQDLEKMRDVFKRYREHVKEDNQTFEEYLRDYNSEPDLDEEPSGDKP